MTQTVVIEPAGITHTYPPGDYTVSATNSVTGKAGQVQVHVPAR